MDNDKPKLVVDNVVDLESRRKEEPEFIIELEETKHAQIAEAIEMATEDLARRSYKGIFITLIQDNAVETLWNYGAGITNTEEVLYRQIASEQKFIEWQSMDDEEEG